MPSGKELEVQVLGPALVGIPLPRACGSGRGVRRLIPALV